VRYVDRLSNSLAPRDESARAADLPAVADIRRVWRVWDVDFDARIVQVIILATLILILPSTNSFLGSELGAVLLQLGVPLLVIVAVWREDPRRYFLRIGEWKLGLVVSAGAIAVMAIVIWYTGHQPDFRSYYLPLVGGRSALQLIYDMGVAMFAWEFFYRGWLLEALGRKYGTDAIWLQMMPFALLHVGKPEIELLSTVLGGAFFGILAWRTRSMLYGWLLHWFMMVWILLVVSS
jgi:membrane protease YdiL (CAAX protease family)